jgi:hypothetical protein
VARTPTKKPRKKKKKAGKISLAPLSYEEAVRALLGTDPKKPGAL